MPQTNHTATLRSITDVATALVDAVGDDQLSGATPCAEWDVRSLLNHMVVAARTFAVAAQMGHIPDDVAQDLAGDVLGTDFRGAWKNASTQLIPAFERPGVLDEVHHLPFGDVRGDVALDLAVVEVGVHSADLARATRYPVTDQAPFATVLTVLRSRMTDVWRAPGILDDERPAPPSADAVDRLLAYAGRHIDGAA